MCSATIQRTAAIRAWPVRWPTAAGIPPAGWNVITRLSTATDVHAPTTAELYERWQSDGNVPGLSAAAAANVRPVWRLPTATGSAATATDENDGTWTDACWRRSTADDGTAHPGPDGWYADAARCWPTHDAVWCWSTGRSDEANTVGINEQSDASVWTNAAGTVHELWAAGAVLTTMSCLLMSNSMPSTQVH